jgi:hypothetical protein
MLFQSNRGFGIWAYTVSHGSLLLRSNMQFPDENDYSIETSFNIDMEFWSVTYISIPTYFENVEIRLIDESLLPADIDRRLCKYDQKIFEFNIDNKKHYIIAAGLLIGTNQWMSEDRIFHYHLNLEHDEILLTA